MPRFTQEQLEEYLNRTSPARVMSRGIPLLDALINEPVKMRHDVPPGALAEAGKELELHNQIIRECRRRGWVYVHSNPTKKATNQPGTPDFIIYASGGHVLNVECKTATGRLSKEQQAFKLRLEQTGHVYHVVRGFDVFQMIANQIVKLAKANK